MLPDRSQYRGMTTALALHTMVKRTDPGSTWEAQSVKRPTLDFSSGHDPRIVRSSPELGSVLSGESAWDSLSPSASPYCSLSLSLK